MINNIKDVTLSLQMNLEFAEILKINNADFYKYKVVKAENKSIEENTGDYYIYFDSALDEKSLNKEELEAYIENTIANNPSNSELFVDSLENFYHNDNVSKNKNLPNADDDSEIENLESDDDDKKVTVKPKLKFYSSDANNGNLIFNADILKKATIAIEGTKNCLAGNSEDLLNEIKKCNPDLDKSCSSIENAISEIGSNLAKATSGYSIGEVTEFYTEKFLEINQIIMDSIIADEAMAAGLINYELPDILKEAAGEETSKEMKDEYLKQILQLLDDIKPDESGLAVIKYAADAFNELHEIQTRFTSGTQEEYLIMINPDIKSAADIKDANLTMEQKEAKYEEIVKYRDSLYEAYTSSTIKGMEMSRDEFDQILFNDAEALAGKLAEAAALQTVSAFKGTQLDDNKTYGGVLSASINDAKNSYYSSSAGQERLHEYFCTTNDINDEYNALGNTEYIKFCMTSNHVDDWLKPELRGIATTIAKINYYDKFSNLRELDASNPDDVEILGIIKQNVNEGRDIPYGYEEVDGKYYAREYTSLGQDLLYYMDYHYAENTWNNGDNRFITSFSNQGYVDAIERGYKNTWIETRISERIKDTNIKPSDVYEEIERDYYVLEGTINDAERKKELQKEGELSFSDYVQCINAAGGDIKNLLDQNYIEAHKDEFAEILGDNILWDFSVQRFNFSDNKMLNIMANGVIDKVASPIRDAFAGIVTLGQVICGISKWAESSLLDATNSFFHSDAFLNDYMDIDEEGNLYVNTIELIASHKNLLDMCLEDYKATGKYEEDFQNFFESSYWKNVVNFAKASYNAESGRYYIKDVGVFSSLDAVTLENAARKLFEKEKLKEWDLNETSSSGVVTAAFKLGIREGGDFSYLDNNISQTIKNAADKQFETKLEVAVDNVGNFYQNNVYSNEVYKFMEDNSVVKHDNILGLVANQVGNMAVPIAISMIPGMAGASSSALGTAIASSANVFKGLSSAVLFTSAFGGAAEEAFANGAGYNEALKYATLSATTELAIEHVFSGIGGYGEGWADKLIEAGYDKVIPIAGDGSISKTIKQLITGGLGEALEEVTTDFVTPMWQSMTYMNDKSYVDIVEENVSLESLAQTAIISFLSSMIFKGVEINQQKNTFNKNYTKLTSEIEKIAGDKLDSTTMKNIADKVLGKFIEGSIENDGVIPSGLLEQLVKTASNELLKANPEYAQELEKLQKELNAFSSQKITIGEGKNSISITGTELLKLEDFTGFNGNYTIEDGKIKFENEDTQKAFNDKVFEMAKNNADNYNSTLGKLVASLTVAKDSIDIDEISTAIGTITEFGKFADTRETVLLEHSGVTIQIPKAILSNNYITSKLSVEEGKIKFKKDMDSDKFIQKLYDKAIRLCNEKIKKNSYDIDKTINKELINKAIEAIEPALKQGNTPITIMNSTNVPENNLIKYDIKFNFLGISKDVSVYVDANTDATALKQVDKINEMIQKAIFSGNSSNIYLGQLVYDSKTKRMNAIQDSANALYVKSLELETNKTIGNMYKLQNIIDSLTENSGKLEGSEIVTIQKDGKSVLIQKSLLEEITNKYKIVDGNVNFTKDMSVDKFISAVYDKAIDLNNQKILGIQNTNIKNATYVNTDGMDLYKLDVETIIDGETRTINVYVDGNTDISSIKNSTKISQTLYELILKNKNSNNVYAGEIVYNEKTDKVNVTENTANKLYVDSINAMSETDEHVETATDEETIETTNEDASQREDIKNGESYEYNIEEVKEDNLTAKTTENSEIKEKSNNAKSVSESGIPNITEATGAGVAAGTVAQTIYQNDSETLAKPNTKKAKKKNIRSDVQNKENIHVETENNNIISISKIKSQVNSYIDSIKTECEKFIEMHKNDENFMHRFEQFKRDKIIELNDKLSEVRKTITDSNSSELNAINKKINSLSESDSLRSELISERDKLIEKQQQELSDIENTAREKLQKVFSELNIEENAESLILNEDFVSTLTLEEREFLTQISTEEGLIEYLQNNPLTNVEILKSREVLNSNNKYVNKLIELIKQNKGVNKRISNAEDVVKNNSNPIFVESVNKMNAKQKVSIFDRLFGKSKSNNSIVSDGTDYIKLDKTLDDISISEVYKYLNNPELLDNLLNGNVQNVDVPKLSSALKTMTMMKDHLGLNLDNRTLKKIEKLYRDNVKRYFIENVEPKLPSMFKDYFALLNNYGGNHTLVIKKLESLGYSSEKIVEGMLSYAASIGYNQESSRKLYDWSCRYLRDIGYEHEKAAQIVCDTYKEMLDLRGYDTITTASGLTINIQKGLVWDSQPYTIDYIQNEISIDKRMYKTNIPVTINLFDSFCYHDKLSEIQYNNPNQKGAASACGNVINIFYNRQIRDIVLPHEYGHLIDEQIQKDNKLKKRFSLTQEYLDAMNMDGNTTTEYAATAGSVEDFAESIALIRKDMKAFQRKHPNRYRVISKYINLDFIPAVKSNSNVNTQMTSEANTSYFMNDAFKVLYETYGGDTAINTLVKYVQTGDISVVPDIKNLRSRIGNIDIRYIQNYLENNFGVKIEPMIKMTSGANLSYQMNNAFKVLYETYGGDTAINTLVKYVQTGDISVVPDIKNLRSRIGNIDIRYIQNYLENNFGVKVSNIELTMNVKKNLDIVYRTLENSYGKSEALARLKNYIETGDLTVITRTDNARNIISRISIDDVIKYVNELNNSYSSINVKSMDSSIITDSDMDFVDVGELSKTTEINIEDVMPNMYNSTKSTVPNTFDIVIDGKVESSLKLEELISNGSKLAGCYELMEESQYDEFNSAIVNYIDYIRENNISVDIDSNVMKFYESYKYAKENNVFIVNNDRILEKGADMIAIPQEIYNKYQNDLTYQTVIYTIIDGIESLDNFENYIKTLYLRNEKYRNCTNNIINFIDSSLRTNENFNAVYNVISKLSEHTVSDNTLFLVNVHDMIYKNAEPIYLPNYINGEFRDGHQAIKIDILLDTILGKNQFPSLYNSNIIENCRKLYNYLQSNNITLNENIMEKLKFVNGLNENQIILNVSEYFDGKSPIVTTEFIKIQDAQISSLDIMEILKMDSDAYIKLLRDDVSEFNNLSSDNLILSIQRLLSRNQILSELYNDNYIKLKDLYDNSYVLKNTLTIVPKMFNGYYTSLIDTILNNPNFINSYSISAKQNLVNAINDFIEYLKSNNVKIEYHQYEKVLEFLNRNVPNIDSSIAIKSEFALELEANEENGGAFGSDQGILRSLLKKTKMNTVIEKLFGNEIEEGKLLEVLSKMDISDEELTKQLLKSNRSLFFAKNATEIKMIDDYAIQVMKNYPGMSKKQAIQFLYLMETDEGGGVGICNYASMVNLVFNKYMNNPNLFEEKLGYPMYVTIDGKRQLNTATLLVDLYSIINEDVLITKENGIYKIAVSNAEYLNLTNNHDGTIVMEYFQKFLDKKGIDMNVSKTFSYNSDTDLMYYEELITNIHDALARGEHIHLASRGFNLYRPNGDIRAENIGGHIMSVVGITSDGNLIVDSWGEKLIFNLKEEMSELGEKYNDNDGNIGSKDIYIVSYNISLDSASNLSTSLDINTESNIHNGANIEIFDVPSSKSNITSSVITDEDLKFIDVSRDTKGVGAFKESAQDMPGDVDSTISNIINIDGVEITVETLKELQIPSNLETALKTGEYAGVRVERALVELSKLDGVTLDSKLQELVKISETLKQGEIIFNIDDVYTKNTEQLILTKTFVNTLNIEEKEILMQISNEQGLIKYFYENALNNEVLSNLLLKSEIQNCSNKYMRKLIEIYPTGQYNNDIWLCNAEGVLLRNEPPVIAYKPRENHLMRGDVIRNRRGVMGLSGVHSSEYINKRLEALSWDRICWSPIDDILKGVTGVSEVNTDFVDIGPKRIHPFIEGVYDVGIDFYAVRTYIDNNNQVREEWIVNPNIKTVDKNMARLLESQREVLTIVKTDNIGQILIHDRNGNESVAIPNSRGEITVNPRGGTFYSISNDSRTSLVRGSLQEARIGMSSNGLFFFCFPNDNNGGNSHPFMELEPSKFNALLNNQTYIEIKIPVKINESLDWVETKLNLPNLNGNITDDIKEKLRTKLFKFGPKLIEMAQAEIDQGRYNATNVIEFNVDLSQLDFKTRVETLLPISINGRNIEVLVNIDESFWNDLENSKSQALTERTTVDVGKKYKTFVKYVESIVKENGYTPGDVINLGELQYNSTTGTIEKVVNSNSTQVVNNAETTDVSDTQVVGAENTVLSSNDTSTAQTNSDSDFFRKSEESSMSLIYVEDVQKNNSSNVEIENEPFNSAVLSTVNIDGVEIEVETLKELQTTSVLETALKTGEYAGVRVEKALVELSKLDGVTLDSKLQELVKISENLKENEIIFNIEDVYSNGVKPNTINIDVYNEFIRNNPNSDISIDDLYEIINSNSVIYRLISNDTIIKNVSNESIKESLEYLSSISNRYNYENKIIREAQYLLDLMNDNYTTEELYDAFAIAHTEFNTPDVYYECYDYLKTMDVDSAIKLLESKGYTTLDITDAFLNLAIRGNSQTYSKHFYYKAFDYLVENGMNEKEAATIIRDKYRTLINRRGTRVVTTTPNGVKIRIVNNISTNNKLFTIEKIESMIKQAEKYYSKTGLKEIVIFDSFAPHNIYSEKVQYEDYVKTHNNRRFVAAASATKSSIILWEDFDQLDSIVHEYGHTIDKHIQSANNLSTVFSSSSIWLEAIQKDTAIASKRVSEYAYATNGEDFAEFLKYFNRNSLEVARKYPNRYKAASKYLNLDIDSNIIERYLDSKKFFIEGIEDLSNLLTEDGSMLEFIKQYLFENLKGDNSISKTVISELDAIYESKLEIIEDYGLYSLFMDMREQERIGSNEFLKIIKDYLDGKDISSKFKDTRNLEIIELLEKEEIQEWYEEELNEMTAETEKIGVSDEEFEKMMNSLFNDLESNSSSDTSIIKDEESTYNDSLIEDADVDMAFPKKSIFSKKIETVSVSDIPRVFRNMNTTDIISILEGKTTLKNDGNFINNKKSIIRFVKYLSDNNIKLSLNERANTIIENLRNGDFRLNILNFSDVLNGDTPIYGPSSINLDGIKISSDDVMIYLENKKNEISSIITSNTPNEDARDLLNAIDELGSKNDIIYDKYRKSIKLIERIERSYVYRSYDSYYLLPKSFNGIDTSNILNSDLMSLTSYINSLSNSDKKSYRLALDEFGKYIYKTNTKLSNQDLSRVNRLYDVINTKKFSPNTVIKSKVYDTFEMSYQNDGEFGSNQGKVREVIEKLGITNVIESLFDEKVERSKFLQTLSEFNISERDFITALNKRTQRGIMNDLFKDGDINLGLYSSLIKQVKINYPNMSTMEAVRFLYLIETKEAGGPGICNNPILVNMIFDKYIGREMEFERDFGYPMYIKSNSGKKVLNEARLLVDIYSTLNDGVLVQNIDGKYVIEATSENYVRAYDLNGLRLDAIEKFIKKKGINLNLSKTYFFNSNEELMHYDYLMEQIKSELDKGNYVIFGGKGFDMDVENFEFREDVGAHGMTIVGIDTTGELILDSWGMKARIDLKKELSRVNELFKNTGNDMIERIFTISSYNIN